MPAILMNSNLCSLKNFFNPSRPNIKGGEKTNMLLLGLKRKEVKYGTKNLLEKNSLLNPKSKGEPKR